MRWVISISRCLPTRTVPHEFDGTLYSKALLPLLQPLACRGSSILVCHMTSSLTPSSILSFRHPLLSASTPSLCELSSLNFVFVILAHVLNLGMNGGGGIHASAERCFGPLQRGHAAGLRTISGRLHAPLLAALTGSSLLTIVYDDVEMADRPSFRSNYRSSVSRHKRAQHPPVAMPHLSLMHVQF